MKSSKACLQHWVRLHLRQSNCKKSQQGAAAFLLSSATPACIHNGLLIHLQLCVNKSFTYKPVQYAWKPSYPANGASNWRS